MFHSNVRSTQFKGAKDKLEPLLKISNVFLQLTRRGLPRLRLKVSLTLQPVLLVLFRVFHSE